MLEWLNRTVSKTVKAAMPSGVRIPLFPPDIITGNFIIKNKQAYFKYCILFFCCLF